MIFGIGKWFYLLINLIYSKYLNLFMYYIPVYVHDIWRSTLLIRSCFLPKRLDETHAAKSRMFTVFSTIKFLARFTNTQEAEITCFSTNWGEFYERAKLIQHGQKYVNLLKSPNTKN